MGLLSNDRVKFIPWSQSQAQEFGDEVAEDHANRDDTHHKRSQTAVFLDNPGGKGLQSLGMGMGTRLHIMGHGGVGAPEIDPPHGAGGSKVSYTQLVQYLIAQGLSKAYAGTIVCDVCNSAEGSPTHKPFAKLLASELWKEGYRMTCVMGYKGDLGSNYNGDLDIADGKNHEYAHRTVGTPKQDGTVKKVKASAWSARERFFGP